MESRGGHHKVGYVIVRFVALMALWAAALCQAAQTPVAMQLDTWRSEAARIRLLAENDAPGAYEAAKRLEAGLPANAVAADRARALNLLSRIETYLALTQPAAAHAKQAFDIAAANGDRVGQAESDLNVVLNSVNRGDIEGALVATQHSVAMLEGLDRPDLLGEAMLRATARYRRFEQIDDAVAVAVRLMHVAQRSNNPLVLAYAHNALTIVFDLSGRVTEAGEHAQQMLEQARAAHSRMLEGFALSSLAGFRRREGDLSGAEQQLGYSISVFREVGAPFATSYALFGLADMLAQAGRHREALRYLDESLDIYRRYPNPISTWYALNARSAEYEALGEIAQAQTDAERAYELAKTLGLAQYLSGSATRRAQVAAAKGNYKRAFDLSLEASELTAKAARENARPRVVELIKRFEAQGKQREIEALRRRSEQQTEQLLKRELEQRWLWTLLAAVALAFIGTAFFVFRVRALNADLEKRVQLRTQELRQRTRYLRTLIDMLPMWTWFKDTQSRYLAVNQAHAAARGHSVESMVGKSDLQLLPPDVGKQQVADDEDVMISRKRKTTEEWVPDKDRGVWMETYKAAVLDDDGTVLGTVGAARDISERKAVEAAREAALSEAQHLARQRSDFLAQMSHELRTPLNAITGFAQLLQRDKTLSERQNRSLRIIDESSHHLLTLINDLLDLARIDAARFELYPEELNLAAFMEIVCDTIRVKADDKGLMFTYHAAADLPGTISVDGKRLRQILLNLLSNAVKFTDSGGITLRLFRVGARLRFEVEDEGIGMRQDQMARLFQHFEQVGEAKRREGGTGLGLAISREVIRLMGGDIQVRSVPGTGSVFSFEIDVPTLQSAQDVSRVGNAPTGYLGERRKILVVDDVLPNRAMLVEVLASLGFHVAEAVDGADALVVVASFRPDLLIMDLTMPRMDGFEATRRLRSLPETMNLPIVVTSASASVETEAHSRAAGANTFISKPIQESALLRAIADLLHLEWTFDEIAPSQVDAAANEDEVVPPPPDEMKVLRELAIAGNMRSIRDRAEHVRALDLRYSAFAAQLRTLAEGYQSSAITNLIDRYSS